MRRLQTSASQPQHYNQLHSQQSMTVSHSPDSVMASDNKLGLSEVNNTALDTSSLATSSSQKQSSQAKTNKNKVVVNPYLKESPNNNNNIPTAPVDPILRKKQQFVDKYRIQAIQHSQRNYSSCGSRSDEVSSVSALDLLRTNRQWRNQQNQSIQDGGENTQSSLSDIIPLRPRLFLFRSHARLQQQQQSQIQNTNEGENAMQIETTIPRQQHPQNDGIWELDKGITEISGEGGSGKTQICLSLCVTTVMTPLLYPHPLVSSNSSGECATGGIANTSLTTNGSIAQVGIQQSDMNNNGNEYYTAIYVTMGEGIPTSNIARRLEQMVQARMNDKHDPNRVKDVLSRIGLLSIRNEEEFIEFVECDLPNLLFEQQQQHQRNNNARRKRTKIGLVAFDGIAGFFRFNDPLFQQSHNPMFHRQRGSKLLQMSSRLRKLSDVYDVPILITNQVTASIPPIVGSGSNSFDTSSLNLGQNVVPALGLMWSNCVSTRYILQRKDGMVATLPTVDDNIGNDLIGTKNVKQTKKKELRMRKARILQSVNMPEKGREVWFVIDTGDVLAVDT